MELLYLHNTMKRIIAILLMVTYLAGATGFSFSLHYCGDHFKHVNFTSDTEKGCCGKGKHKPNCCKDKTIKASIKGDQSLKTKAVVAKIFFENTPSGICYLIKQRVYGNHDVAALATNTSPPFLRTVPVYLQNCLLRI